MIANAIETAVLAALPAVGAKSFNIESDVDGVTAWVTIPVVYVNDVAGDFHASTRLLISKVEAALRGFRFVDGSISRPGEETFEYRLDVDPAAQLASIEGRLGALERAGVIVGGKVRTARDNGREQPISGWTVIVTVAAVYDGDEHDAATAAKFAAVKAALPELKSFDAIGEGENEVVLYHVA
jgi:hypothetical protein